MYQRMKNKTEEMAEKLKLSKVLEKPWTHLIVDFIMKLPVVAGKNTILIVVICKFICPEITSPQWNHLQIIQACLPWWPPFSQHVSWQCCNHPGIPSFTVEILLFNLVFYDGVTLVSVSTLKPPLRVIGVLPLKPQASPKLSVCI